MTVARHVKLDNSIALRIPHLVTVAPVLRSVARAREPLEGRVRKIPFSIVLFREFGTAAN